MSMPELTETGVFHMTGEGFRLKTFDIFADGKATDLIRRYRCGGPPDFTMQAHELVFRAGKEKEEEILDLLADPPHNAREWVLKHL